MNLQKKGDSKEKGGKKRREEDVNIGISTAVGNVGSIAGRTEVTVAAAEKVGSTAARKAAGDRARSTVPGRDPRDRVPPGGQADHSDGTDPEGQDGPGGQGNSGGQGGHGGRDDPDSQDDPSGQNGPGGRDEHLFERRDGSSGRHSEGARHRDSFCTRAYRSRGRRRDDGP